VQACSKPNARPDWMYEVHHGALQKQQQAPAALKRNAFY